MNKLSVEDIVVRKNTQPNSPAPFFVIREISRTGIRCERLLPNTRTMCYSFKKEDVFRPDTIKIKMGNKLCKEIDENVKNTKVLLNTKQAKSLLHVELKYLVVQFVDRREIPSLNLYFSVRMVRKLLGGVEVWLDRCIYTRYSHHAHKRSETSSR